MSDNGQITAGAQTEKVSRWEHRTSLLGRAAGLTAAGLWMRTAQRSPGGAGGGFTNGTRDLGDKEMLKTGR